MWALIDEIGRVCEFFEQDPGPWPAPQRIMDVSEVPGIAENWRLGPDGAFSPPAPPTPTEAEARARRDAALAASDWTQIPDAPLSQGEREAWAAYRAALRAVPRQPGFPETITWPEAPTRGVQLPPAAALTREAQP